MVSTSWRSMVCSGSSEVSGILKDHADAGTADFALFEFAQGIDALSAETYLAAGQFTRRLKQADYRIADSGFPGTRFTDHTQDLAWFHLKGQMLDRDDMAATAWEFHPHL